MPKKKRCVGILTAGGDSPGLNAAIRGVAKAAMSQYGIEVIGVLDGFRGLVEMRTMPLDDHAVSGILTHGGTLLGTSRDKPHKMQMGRRFMDMTATAVANASRLGIECLVCLGGGGTQKNALALQQAGLDVITLPKTIDNDVAGTDISFGFDTAMTIATEAIDRLHTTATSHNRLIVCEIMGHSAGWLALGAGIAGGADVILIPEIPYDPELVAEHLFDRRRHGKRFSIIAVAEGARSKAEVAAAAAFASRDKNKDKTKKNGKSTEDDKDKDKDKDKDRAKDKSKGRQEATRRGRDEPSDDNVTPVQEPMASRLARELQRLTGTEARVTSLGHVQRGGTPTAADRLLCTRLGTRAAQLLEAGEANVMVAVKGERCEPVPLSEVAGKKKLVPLDHPWIEAARLVETCLGDR
jgi:6-phosphofructokinase 1